MNSRIILAKNIKLDKNYNNVLSYSESNMVALCQANAVASDNYYSFIRQNKNRISTHFTFSQCIQSNYIAFQNYDYSNKWFFAFIDEVIYKNDGTTEIQYTIDEWSTWFDYWQKKSCFVVREHVNDDTVGLHTIPENIDVGEVEEIGNFVDEAYRFDFDFGIPYYICISTNYIPNDNSTTGGKDYSGIFVYNNVVSGTKYVFFRIDETSDFKNVAGFILRATSDKSSSVIENIFIVPNVLINQPDLESHTAYIETISDSTAFTWYTLPFSFDIKEFDTNISKVTSFSDIDIKNNKCYCYPYNYLFVTNNQGNNNIYKYEDFNRNSCLFRNRLALTIGCSGRLIPVNYKGQVNNIDESIPLAKYPTCAWSSDAYTNWLTQNGVNIASSITGIITGTLTGTYNSSASGLTSEKRGSMIQDTGMSASSSIAGLIGSFYSASLLPNISGGNSTADVMWADNQYGFYFHNMRAKKEYLLQVDSYFSRYGYKINRIKTPNITGRRYWNYVEIGPNDEIGNGQVPSNSMEIINNSARRGVTIWHDHNSIGNFNLTNSII